MPLFGIKACDRLREALEDYDMMEERYYHNEQHNHHLKV
jgi:hypothetical protein